MGIKESDREWVEVLERVLRGKESKERAKSSAIELRLA